MSNQRGFTLIELVMVIVILGILAATALPRFINLQDDAQTAANQGFAGSLSSASAINYAARLAQGASGTGFQSVIDCSDATAAALLVGYDSTAYSIASVTDGGDALGDIDTCTIIHVGDPTGVAANWQLIAVP